MGPEVEFITVPLLCLILRLDRYLEIFFNSWNGIDHPVLKLEKNRREKEDFGICSKY